MTIDPKLLRLPAGFAASGDPIDANPFEEGTAAQAEWAQATHEAEQEVCQLDVRLLSQVPTDVEELNAVAVERLAALFDIWSKRFVHVVRSDRLLETFDKWLVRYSTACLESLAGVVAGPAHVQDAAVVRLRGALALRVKYWKGEARRYRAEQREDQTAAHAAARDLAQPVPALDRYRETAPRETSQVEPVPRQKTARKTGPDARRVGGAKLAAWMKAEMKKRDNMTVHRLHELSTLDAKTIRGLLEGKRARRNVVNKLMDGFGVEEQEIPQDD